jgi:hypothetical protein
VAAFGDYHHATGAGWSVYWRVPKIDGGGLELWWADFKGRRVMWRGSQPFALVPYHGGSPIYKDGVDAQGGGAPFTPLKHGAPNAWNGPSWLAANDREAVTVTTEPGNDFGPACLVISAKFQCGWHQYVHRWELDADGVIHPRVAVGGQLHPQKPHVAHVHHMYFRIDLDIDGQFARDVVEVFEHAGFAQPSGDAWRVVPAQSKLIANPGSARKWRVRSTVSASASGAFRGYEIEIPQLAGRDTYSTGDVWVAVYRGDGMQQGEGVGVNCTDRELETTYANGSLDPTTGNDIVVWCVVRAHHEPRAQAEEADRVPYHYDGLCITPRNFSR